MMTKGTRTIAWKGEGWCPLPFVLELSGRQATDDSGRRKPVFMEDGV